MNQTRPTETIEGNTCPFCSKGRLKLCQVEYRVETPDEPAISIPGVWVEQCSSCDGKVFPAESSRFIEQVIAERTEQLTPTELQRIRRELGVDQTEMSEILGLGGRTYHRWEKGNQYPSRSMCYYIRIFSEFPEAFDWLTRRGWRSESRIIFIDFSKRFPDLAKIEEQQVGGRINSRFGKSVNPARGLLNVVFG